MANSPIQNSFKPTKADKKLASKEYRANHFARQDCFISKTGPGAICTEMQLDESQETFQPRHKRVYRGSPETIFNAAIAKVSTECNATALQSAPDTCEQNTSYAFNYTIKTKQGMPGMGPLFRDYELNADLNTCQDSQGQWANHSQLLLCTKELLDQAASQAAYSFNEPTSDSALKDIGGSIAFIAVTALAICGTVYCCYKKPTAEQRERQAQQREALLLAPQTQVPPQAIVVPPPDIGNAPNIF